MITTIGRYDRTTGQVTVVFEEGDVRHERQVNACVKEDGTHDRRATTARVAEVALGVAVKIGIGLKGSTGIGPALVRQKRDVGTPETA